MKKFSDFKIQNRLNYFLGGSVLTILFIVCSIAVIYSYNSYRTIVNVEIGDEIKNIDSIIKMDYEEKQTGLESNSYFISELINTLNIKRNKEHFIHTKAFDIKTQELRDEDIPCYLLNNCNLYNDTAFVDKLGKYIKGTIIINIKTNDGFVGIATNIKDKQGKRSINGFIPINSETGKKMLNANITLDKIEVYGKQYISAYTPIIKNGEIIGSIIASIDAKNMENLQNTIYKKKFLQTGFAFLLKKNGEFIMHPDTPLIGQNASESEFYKKIINSDTPEGQFEITYKEKKILFYKYNDILDSYIIADVNMSEYREQAINASVMYLVILLIASILFMFINRIIVRSIKKPLNKCVAFTKEIATGNISTTLDIDQKDEFGQLAESLKIMLHKLKRVIQGIKHSSETIINASHTINEASQQLSNSTNEQASTIEEVATTMEEMVSAIKENSLNAKNTNEISCQAQDVMQKLHNESTKLANSVNNISGKISIINDIAMQTDILSLNARVESSRAGVHGKGFGVVAQEIRKLADVSKTAAKEIFQISSSSIDIAVNTGEQLNDLMPRIKQTSELINGITVASSQQYNGAEQVNQSIQQINHSIQINASTSEELASSASQLSKEVDEMEKLISFFKI